MREFLQVVGRPEREDDADQGTAAGQEEAFGEHLPDQPHAGGTERGADRQLLLAQGGAGELHVHHVDAGDQQQAHAKRQHGPKQALQRRRRESLDQRFDQRGVELLVGVGEARRQAFGDAGVLRIGLIERDAGLDEAEHRDLVAGRAQIVAGRGRELAVERDPQLLVHREGESRRHDADDGRRLAVDADAFADDVAAGPEIALPELVADERHLLGARLVVGGGKIAPDHRGDSEDAEEIGGDVGAGIALRIPVDGDVDGGAIDVGRQQVEGLLLLAQFLVVEGEDLAAEAVDVGVALGEVDDLHADKAAGVGKREAAQHHGIDDAELRGHAADAEREHGDGEQAEGFLLDQDAEPDAEILKEGGEEHGRNGVQAARPPAGLRIDLDEWSKSVLAGMGCD